MANELVKTDTMNASFTGMTQLPIVRQLGLLIGLAASIAVGVGMVLWMQKPNFNVLYNNVSARDAGEITAALDKEGIRYQVDTEKGLILVDSSKVHEARMKLASQGLPNHTGSGFELIDKEQGFGTSNFVQNARYQRALEGELARTIMSVSAIQNARVHLALPKETAFIRDNRKASASVMIEMNNGRQLDDEQVGAIMHLVASSVPNMESEQVTVVDNKGHLLSKTDPQGGIGLSARQFQYTRQLELDYVDRIENILSPIVGSGKVRAQVTAEMDFTDVEMTQESFNPDQPAVRSEQRIEERMQGNANEGGVPGALSNEPPAAAQAPEQINASAPPQTGAAAQPPSKSKVRVTVNNELDRSIVHKRKSPGLTKRLSVAVVVDNKSSTDENGEVKRSAYSKEELDRFTALVKEAVGFSAMRGDSVNVINAEFSPPPALEPATPTALLDKPWVWDLGKQVLGGLVAVLIMLGVLRPVMRNLSTLPAAKKLVTAGGGDGLEEDQVTLSGQDTAARLSKPREYESDLQMAKAMVVQEPKRVAQVVKQWVGEGN
ncbi:MAG: flagellar M-ring protein FliF [Gammaproteobacteria bacterium]|nr:flagellar M-ring protein FliF [Gammaproteobacteria bacterium]